MRFYVSLLTFCLALCACGVEDAAAGPEPGSHLLETVQELQLLTSGQGFSPADGYVPGGFSTVATTGNGQLNGLDGQVQIKSGPWMVPVTVPLGTPISGFGTQLIDNGAPSANTVKVELVSSTSGTLGSITSSGNGNDQGWTSTFGSVHVTTGGEMLWFRCSPKTSGGAWASTNSTIEALSLFVAPQQRTVRLRPQWLVQAPFVIAGNPVVGSANPPVWKSTGTVPAVASFEIPFTAGDTIVALGWDAYGDGGGGLGSIDVMYESTVGGLAAGGTIASPASTFDVNRPATWGHVNVAPFSPLQLGANGFLWVALEVDAVNYYIGDITVTFAR